MKEVDKKGKEMQGITNGTEKQKAWARDIRDRFVAAVEEVLPENGPTFGELMAMDAPEGSSPWMMQRVFAVSDAGWWINQKDLAPSAANVVILNDRI